MNQARGGGKPGNKQKDGVAPEKKTLHERAFEKIDLNQEIRLLEEMIKELKIEYEQFFLGLFPYQPDKLHKQVKQQIRKLHKAPFKRQEHVFRIRAVESRYNTYNDYWQRTLRQKEEGTYSKDVFKAKLRERHRLEDQEATTLKGAAAKQMNVLFESYKKALEKQTGKTQNIDFNAFQKTLLKRAQAHREKNGNQKLSFKVVVKEGKVTIKAKTAGTSKPGGDARSAAAQKKKQLAERATPPKRALPPKPSATKAAPAEAARPKPQVNRAALEAKMKADALARKRALERMKKAQKTKDSANA